MNMIMHEFRSDLVGGTGLRTGIGDGTCFFSVIWVRRELTGVTAVIIVPPLSFSAIELSIACTNP